MQLFWGKRINDNVILVEGDEVLHLTKNIRKLILEGDSCEDQRKTKYRQQQKNLNKIKVKK